MMGQGSRLIVAPAAGATINRLRCFCCCGVVALLRCCCVVVLLLLLLLSLVLFSCCCYWFRCFAECVCVCGVCAVCGDGNGKRSAGR